MDERAGAHVVVVGGGVAGLAAAWFLHRGGRERVRVTVLEAAPRLGGKLRLAELGGIPVDVGAEALLARRPEAVDLVRAVGLADELVHPQAISAGVWSRGRVRPLPAGQVMGVPADLRALAASGVLSARGVARAAAERVLPARQHPGDVPVGAYLRARLGREVVDRLVDPLLAGVYAGHADRLSLAATLPQLAPAARDGTHVTALARQVRARASTGPVFAGIRGGVGRLPAALAEASGAVIRTGVTVRDLERTAHGWRLITGPAPAAEQVTADAVLLAVPAGPASRVLAAAAPGAAAELSGIAYASMAVVSLLADAGGTGAGIPRGSGFLVPAVEGKLVKAVTLSSAKWAWTGQTAGPGGVLLRASVGRHGEQADLARDDDDLVRAVLRELAGFGLPGEAVDTLVTRWGGALPQYAVGHLDRVARIRAAVAAQPGLAVCGAAYDGIGVAACVASAATAATRILDGLADATVWRARPTRGGSR